MLLHKRQRKMGMSPAEILQLQAHFEFQALAAFFEHWALQVAHMGS